MCADETSSQRVAPPGGSDGAAVVVDHRHRALRIQGEIFVGKGFYWPNTARLSLAQQEQWMFYLSQQGVNMLELGLNMRSPSNATRILAMAHSHGIKVMFSVVGDVDHIMNCTSEGCDSEVVIRSRMSRLFKIVDTHRFSPALLSWCSILLPVAAFDRSKHSGMD
jgi:hypothetical protein